MSDLSLAVGCCFYQDAPGLKRLCDSLESIPFVSKIYAVDGRFIGPTFGDDSDPHLSTEVYGRDNYNRGDDDNNHDARLKTIPLAASEWQKRQCYVTECYRDRPDFIFILDTDEYVICNDLQQFKDHLEEIKQQMLDNPKYIYHNVYDVNFDDKTQGIKNLKPRIWFRPYQMEYTDFMAYRNKQYVHYHTDPSGSMYPIGVIRGITVIHDKWLRTEEYETKNREYHKRQLVNPLPLPP